MKPTIPDRPSSVIAIYDTTLRDGTQREGISVSAVDKIQIARLLDGLGITFLELGWPGSNPKDAEVFARARDVAWSWATISAFGATRRAGISAADDPQIAALLETGAPVCTIFGKSSRLHVKEVLRVGAEENVCMIGDTVGYLTRSGRRVIYDAEQRPRQVPRPSCSATPTVGRCRGMSRQW
jgi:2-isopropylmalate synthase